MTCSIKQTILDLDKAVPRYTSYPTAPHFKAMDDASVYAGWLGTLAPDAVLSLYLHVPFCSKMCWYCGCHTKATKRYDPIEAYVGFVLEEIELLAAALGHRHRVGHIHFGGGTPGILKPADFEAIMVRLDKHFDIDYEGGELAIEIDPRSVDEDKVKSYAKCGVNRISLGVQDINEKTLEAVNRPQPFELSLNAVEMFKRHDIERFNIDLLYGLPHQSVESTGKTIDKVMQLSPDRISLFGYAHVPWMKKHMRLIDEGSLPDKNLRYDLFCRGEEKLLEFGYVPIGIDHFAKAGDSLAKAAGEGSLHRNFQGYTSDSADTLLGIGASSIGKFPQGYVQNAVDMPIYEESIASGVLPVRKYCALSEEDRLRADVIEHLMCNFKADIPTICCAHGFKENHLDGVLTNLEAFERQNMLVISEEKVLTLLPHARLVARLICVEFDTYFSCSPKKDKHAKAI
jgi:oxygen-independent coproporphyrinogen-3 oxidase